MIIVYIYHCYYINMINTARQSLAIGSSGFDHTLLIQYRLLRGFKEYDAMH